MKPKFLFLFFDMSTQEVGEGIQTSDLHFIRCGLQPIKLPLGDQKCYSQNNTFFLLLFFFLGK